MLTVAKYKLPYPNNKGEQPEITNWWSDPHPDDLIGKTVLEGEERLAALEAFGLTDDVSPEVEAEQLVVTGRYSGMTKAEAAAQRLAEAAVERTAQPSDTRPRV